MSKLNSSKLKPVNVGAKYSRLTILKEVEPKIRANGRARRRVECLCECGSSTVVDYAAVKAENTKSCGCLSSIRTIERNTSLRSAIKKAEAISDSSDKSMFEKRRRLLLTQ